MNERYALQEERCDLAQQRMREAQGERDRLQTERDTAERLRREAFEKIDAAHKRMHAAERKYEVARRAQEQMEEQHAEVLEIRDAFGEEGLEVWPMFPGRKVHRVLDSDEFDGRVSQEFRVKDAESGAKGVTLLMGRLANSRGSE